MRRLCASGDGRVVHARGLCTAYYQRAMYHRQLDPLPPDYTEWSWPGFAVSRYTWRGVSCNDLPTVWAAEDAAERRSA